MIEKSLIPSPMRFWTRLDVFLLVSLVIGLIWKLLAPESPLAEQGIIVLSVIALLPVLRSAWQSLLDRQIAVDLLASIALIASFANHEWTSAAFINLMLTSARAFGDRTARNSQAAIESLLELKPKTVRVRRDDKVTEIPVEEVRTGDQVIVGLGERIPVDGTVVEGAGLVDESSLTGESLPVSKDTGSEAYSSTLVTDGSLMLRAERIGKDTTLEKIIRLVQESQNTKVGIQTLAQTFANWYIAFILVGSLALYALTRDHTLVLAFLLIACADDLAVAIPLAFSAAIGAAARQGIIVKGSRFLEGLAHTRTILFDKTGTLTTGHLSMEDILVFDGEDRRNILLWSASLEAASTHPVAQAIRRAAGTESLSAIPVDALREVSGKGVTATVEGHALVCGRGSFLEENGIPLPQDRRMDTAASHLYVARDGRVAGVILLTDTVRPESVQALAALRSAGIEHTVMLTGDNEKTAEKVAHATGIDEFRANLLPEDKVGAVKGFLNKKSKVVMVGDGVNDAAALASADIGIAMGAIGSDVAIEAADIALMRDDLGKLPAAIAISQDAVRVSRQNFWIWGATNAVGLVLVFTHVLDPAGAAAYNFLSDFVPITNSLRLFRRLPDDRT